MGHEFIDTAGGIQDVLSVLPKFSDGPIYIKYAPDWGLYILANEPITPEKAQRWWNEDVKPTDEDYAHTPPTLMLHPA